MNEHEEFHHFTLFSKNVLYLLRKLKELIQKFDDLYSSIYVDTWNNCFKLITCILQKWYYFSLNKARMVYSAAYL